VIKKILGVIGVLGLVVTSTVGVNAKTHEQYFKEIDNVMMAATFNILLETGLPLDYLLELPPDEMGKLCMESPKAEYYMVKALRGVVPPKDLESQHYYFIEYWKDICRASRILNGQESATYLDLQILSDKLSSDVRKCKDVFIGVMGYETYLEAIGAGNPLGYSGNQALFA
jgi:hypothetical protein